MTEGVEILIIDDEIDMGLALVELLEDEGYKVAEAKNGKMGLEYLSNNPGPKLILLDYMMPEMTGAEFCEALNRNPIWKEVPVALVSAASISSEQTAKMKISAFVEKPLDIEKFLVLVAKLSRQD